MNKNAPHPFLIFQLNPFIFLLFKYDMTFITTKFYENNTILSYERDGKY